MEAGEIRFPNWDGGMVVSSKEIDFRGMSVINVDCTAGWSSVGTFGRTVVGINDTTHSVPNITKYSTHTVGVSINHQVIAKLSIGLSRVVGNCSIYRIWLN
mgnify:FL=1